MVRQNGTGLVVYKNTGDIDAIDQHSRHLVDALVKGGYPALYRAVGLPRAREIDSGALEGVHAAALRGCRPRVADPAQVARCLVRRRAPDLQALRREPGPAFTTKAIGAPIP